MLLLMLMLLRIAVENSTTSVCARLVSYRSRELVPEPHNAKTKKHIRHHNKYQQVGPVFEKMCAAQNDCAHERDEIRRRKQRTERIENPRHCFTRENEARKENARQQEDHGHLQRLHLVFGSGPNEQTEA